MLLLYSRHCSGSVEWARYLHKLFTELSRNKSRLTVRHLPVEVLYKYYYLHNIIICCMYGQDLAGCGGQALPPRLEAELHCARLQLVIVSPVFLQWVYRNPALLVGRLLQQDRSVMPRKLLAMLSIWIKSPRKNNPHFLHNH